MTEKSISTRVIIFTTSFFPYVGGSEIAIHEITKRLKDVFFHIITHRFTEELSKEEDFQNGRISRVGYGWTKFFLPITGLNRAIKNSPAFKENNQRPIIQAYQASYGGGAAWIYKKIWPKSVFILTLQEGKDLSGKNLVTFFRNLIIKKADIITAISNYLADYARKVNPRAKIVVIPNGVDIQNFSRGFSDLAISNLKKKLGIEPDNKIVISASRLVSKNGLDILIKAIAILNQNKDNEFKLIIAGNHPFFDKSRRKKLEKMAEELGIGNSIIFAGIIDRYELPLYFKISNIFARPSRSEGLGNAFLEAMATGLPVIGTPVGGIPDFLKDGQTGLFCKVNNPADLAEKIKMLMVNKELRMKIVDNGRKLVTEKYDWNIIAWKFREIYGYN